MEIWRTIKDFPLYQVSNIGRVRSLRKGKIKIISPSNTLGYLQVGLYKGIRSNKKVHRLVAEAFIPNPENKPFINHINGIKNDNLPKNLEWCTQKENVVHAYKIGLCSDKKGEGNGRSVVTEDIVREIRTIKGLRISQIARQYKLKWNCVSDIIKRETWQHI